MLSDAFRVMFIIVCRFIDLLDQIDTRVEKLRKEALYLQERRDGLLMSMDVLKNNELMSGLNECKCIIRIHKQCIVVMLSLLPNSLLCFFFSIIYTDELDEINCYAQRISSRLNTIDLSVKTVRDTAQEESLHQVNSLIDSLITSTDRLLARQRCQTFLNGCSGNDPLSQFNEKDQMVDKKFEMAVLGCTLDDQKIIKKRLQALMTYLNKQTISD